MVAIYRIALDPNAKRRRSFASRQGHTLARTTGPWPSVATTIRGRRQTDKKRLFRRLLNHIKEEAYPWMLEVSKNVIQQAIKNVGVAFTNFFGRLEAYQHEPDPRRKKRLKKQLGYPKFKKKGRSRDAFRADNGLSQASADALRVDGVYVVLPKIGRIRMREPLRFSGPIEAWHRRFPHGGPLVRRVVGGGYRGGPAPQKPRSGGGRSRDQDPGNRL